MCMRRVNRSVPWKEQARTGLAPDLSVRQCQKGGSGPPFFSTHSPVFSVQLRTALLDELGEHLLALNWLMNARFFEPRGTGSGPDACRKQHRNGT